MRVFRMAERHADSIVSLKEGDFSVNSTGANQSDLSRSTISEEKRLKLIDYFLSILKNRELCIQSKCEASLESSRYLSLGNATVVEKDYEDSLCELYAQLELCYIFEDIFQRGVESTILCDIIKENVEMQDNSFHLPKPPMKNASKLEKSLLNSMTDIADKSLIFDKTRTDTSRAAVERLDATRKHVDQLERFRLFKAKLNREKEDLENQALKDMQERQRKIIKSINLVRGIVTNVIGNAGINYLEHPEIVDIIIRCRKVVTEENIEKEASSVISAISQSDK